MSVCYTGLTYCHKCGFAGPVKGARMLGGSRVDTGCAKCTSVFTHSVPRGVAWVYDEGVQAPKPNCANCGLPLQIDDDGGEYVHACNKERVCPNMLGRNWKAFHTDAKPLFGCIVTWQEESS